MSRKPMLFAAAIIAAFGSLPARAQDRLTGDAKLACEAILCLSSGQRPEECSPSLRRYFSIHPRRINDMIRDRRNFLNLCPTANDASTQMPSLVTALAAGAGRCDAASLNATLTIYRWGGDRGDGGYTVLNTLPAYCAAYINHVYTDLPGLAYYGILNVDGRWYDRQACSASYLNTALLVQPPADNIWHSPYINNVFPSYCFSAPHPSYVGAMLQGGRWVD
ncbi:TrbM/KikA/MpfK family conjugal transfer protein [Roseateles sp. GG27B]